MVVLYNRRDRLKPRQMRSQSEQSTKVGYFQVLLPDYVRFPGTDHQHARAYCGVHGIDALLTYWVFYRDRGRSTR